MRDREKAAARARALVEQMSIEERAAQLKYDAPAVKRLGIPFYNWWNEALHGVARAGTATVYPQAVGLAAAFDPALLEKAADQISTEARAKYNACSEEGDRDIYKGLTMWSPNVNIFRDPRWGRGQETYGEDPFLTKELGKAFVRGLQGDGKYLKTAACAKHFAVHSGPEAIRHEFNAVASKKDMEETYLPAFRELVTEAGVEAVMGAYNRTNGEVCCASKTLIEEKLRGEWGFEGHFVSDCWAIRDFHENHHVSGSPAESAAIALKGGCDLNCGNTYLWVLRAYQEGLVSEEDITRAAVRLMTTRILLGLMDDDCEYDRIPYTMVEAPEHLATSQEFAEKSIVLLKNDGILPLAKDEVKTIGVIGPNADSRAALIGNYHGTPSEYITLLDGIRRSAGEDCRILYSQGCALGADKVEPMALLPNDRLAEAKTVAKYSDVVVLCIGLDETMEGEEGDTGNAYASGDKGDLLLPEPQRLLMEAVASVGKPVICVNCSGSAMDLSYADEHFNAVLQAWYPGARGGLALGRILFGACSPSGKLPVTFYRDLTGLPDFEDYSMQGRTYRYMQGEAFYPFGYGLTYSHVQVKEAEAAASDDADAVAVLAEVGNDGPMDTDEVLQVYVRNMTSPFARENYHLCGMQRFHIGAGETRKIRILIPLKELTVVDEEGKRFLDGSSYRFYIGFNQPDQRSISLSRNEVMTVDLSLKQ